MNKLLLTLALASIVVGTGCAGPQPAAQADAKPASNTAVAATTTTPLIGSRLDKRSTDRSVRTIDNQTFKDETPISGRGNDLGARGN
jgi:hypothetical protein